MTPDVHRDEQGDGFNKPEFTADDFGNPKTRSMLTANRNPDAR